LVYGQGTILPTDFGPKLSKEKRLAPVVGQRARPVVPWARAAFIPSPSTHQPVGAAARAELPALGAECELRTLELGRSSCGSLVFSAAFYGECPVDKGRMTRLNFDTRNERVSAHMSAIVLGRIAPLSAAEK
jgi:hypothetical protein